MRRVPVLYRVCAAYKYPRVWPRQRSGNCGPSSSSFSVCFDDRHLRACCAATVFLNSCFHDSSSTSCPCRVNISRLVSATSVSFHLRLCHLLCFRHHLRLCHLLRLRHTFVTIFFINAINIFLAVAIVLRRSSSLSSCVTTTPRQHLKTLASIGVNTPTSTLLLFSSSAHSC